MRIVVEPDPAKRAAYADELRKAGYATAVDMEELQRYLAANPDTILVVLTATIDLDEALAFAAYQRVQRPELSVVLVRTRVTNALLQGALRAGVRDVVRDDVAEIRAACLRATDVGKAMQSTVRPVRPADSNAKVITVFAGKGGCGKSVVATNLAVALAAGGSRRVLLIDLDLQFGDVAIMLKLAPARGIADAVPMAGRLDEPGLRSLITHYLPGCDTLLAPGNPAAADQVSRDLVTELLTTARPLYDFIVIDTSSAVTEQVLAALDRSDWYILVVTPDLPTLKSVRLTVEMFDLLNYPPEQRLILFNRADSQVGLSIEDVEEAVGAPLSTHMPSSRDVPTSVNRGTPLILEAPTHPVSRAVRGLADRCAGIDREPDRQRRSVFTMPFRRPS
ncbi:AAA family ATPase [Dactylosporangium sp. CS-033363]|uniref:AAA family ATPase n=1 Tax=Dactylosporangium sp. CS-033363 TaxID=3239935 RepID=UPI003D8F26C0